MAANDQHAEVEQLKQREDIQRALKQTAGNKETARQLRRDKLLAPPAVNSSRRQSHCLAFRAAFH